MTDDEDSKFFRDVPCPECGAVGTLTLLAKVGDVGCPDCDEDVEAHRVFLCSACGKHAHTIEATEEHFRKVYGIVFDK